MAETNFVGTKYGSQVLSGHNMAAIFCPDNLWQGRTKCCSQISSRGTTCGCLFWSGPYIAAIFGPSGQNMAGPKIPWQALYGVPKWTKWHFLIVSFFLSYHTSLLYKTSKIIISDHLYHIRPPISYQTSYIISDLLRISYQTSYIIQTSIIISDLLATYIISDLLWILLYHIA